MKTPIQSITSEITVTGTQNASQLDAANAVRKPRPHIIANRAARQARRANR